MYALNYHRAGSVAEAASALSGAADGKFVAGGQTLIPTMKQRLASPSDLVDLTKIPGLAGIEVSGDTVTIGATTRHYDVASSAAVKQAIPALADLAAGIGDPAVRYQGTIGGSLANNDPAADYPAAVLGLGATVVTNKRRLAAADYFHGLFTTALEDDEIITAVSFPVPAKAAYVKFPNPASRFAMTGVFVAKLKDGSVRVAVTGAGDGGVFRAAAIEAALTADWSPEAAGSVAVSPNGLLADIHGSADYRANLISVGAKRAVAAAA
ncbi:MAG: xanthine dehydrogenase family protein subunit M [Ancalomicrobiaceae bacterium]|nr:xanthine dehydrogenase family protein subunit M [Ancalomicrobiaceae bacterium]